MSSAPASEWAPKLPDDLVRGILARLPLDNPRFIFRASLVCKDWFRVASEPAFLLHLYQSYGSPPVLGFLHNPRNDYVASFFRITTSPFPLANVPDHRSWTVLDYRHGRALFISTFFCAPRELLVWEPITGDRRRVPVPAACECHYPGAAVVCARPGCDHRGGCHGGHFRVAFLFAPHEYSEYGYGPSEEEMVINGCVYSSDTGTWGKVTSRHWVYEDFGHHSSVLVGEWLIYFLSDGQLILEYDMVGGGITDDIHPPVYERITLVVAHNGGIGIAQELESYIVLWSLESVTDESAQGDIYVQWERTLLIDIGQLNLPIDDFLSFIQRQAEAPRFAEGANVILLVTSFGIFMFDPHSEVNGSMVCQHLNFSPLIPVVSFYAPPTTRAPRGEHHELPPSPNPSEEHGERDAPEYAKQLSNKGSNAIKEGLNLAPKIRVGDVPKNTASKESKESKDDAGNSKVCGSSAQDAHLWRKDILIKGKTQMAKIRGMRKWQTMKMVLICICP